MHLISKFILYFFFSLVALPLIAQYNLTIQVTFSPADTKDIFIAGNFNEWSPGKAAYRLEKQADNSYAITLTNMIAAEYTFKFTQGNWEKVETTNNGTDILNRIVVLNKDTTIVCTIAAWKKEGTQAPGKNTASANVSIIDTAFPLKYLHRTRRIWVYLPHDYEQGKKKYPVLYMHDGQNLFTESTAPFGEWGIDEALDSLQKKLPHDMIVVGIDHGKDKRMNEYNPYDNDTYGKGEGDAYATWLIEELMPYINKRYRTKKTVNYIAGSSMGGLISMYIFLKHPKVFSGAGVFSPSFWLTPRMADEAKGYTYKKARKIFFYAGGKESTTMVNNMRDISTIMAAKYNVQIKEIVIQEGMHNEAAWRSIFPSFYTWLTGK
ncbi:MAG: alpha/beta hydrolase-fold protein [Ferruginibacter sp.]